MSRNRLAEAFHAIAGTWEWADPDSHGLQHGETRAYTELSRAYRGGAPLDDEHLCAANEATGLQERGVTPEVAAGWQAGVDELLASVGVGPDLRPLN